eukprot:2742040-Pyramimonas_sp.AAC.1
MLLRAEPALALSDTAGPRRARPLCLAVFCLCLFRGSWAPTPQSPVAPCTLGMADDAHGAEVPASLVEQFDLAATFPSQELGAGRGKGGKGAVPPPRKRAAHDHSAAEGADGTDAWSSDDYLRQLCRDEFDSMRAVLTSAVSESIRAT